MSGALDRLHYEKDPCVRYDSPRKVWIYLHRGRSEEDFGEGEGRGEGRGGEGEGEGEGRGGHNKRETRFFAH